MEYEPGKLLLIHAKLHSQHRTVFLSVIHPFAGCTYFTFTPTENIHTHPPPFQRIWTLLLVHTPEKLPHFESKLRGRLFLVASVVPTVHLLWDWAAALSCDAFYWSTSASFPLNQRKFVEKESKAAVTHAKTIEKSLKLSVFVDRVLLEDLRCHAKPVSYVEKAGKLWMCSQKCIW